ncbi:hypothetical protein ANN_08763, partial [Periplaneta americana]
VTLKEIAGLHKCYYSFSLLHEAATQLGAVVTQKFDEAVRAEDLASLARFLKIFPLLGMQDEGLIKFSLYLCSKVILQNHAVLTSIFLKIADIFKGNVIVRANESCLSLANIVVWKR